MIDHPQPTEIEPLLELARGTGFFRPDELEVIHELLDKYFAHIQAIGQPGWDFGDYIWAVYRDAPGTVPLGFACYGPVEMSEDVYDLYWLAVDRSHQDKKLGTALLQYVEQDLIGRRARQLYIETSDTSQYTPTRAFYTRRGYEQVGYMTDFYTVGDGKVVYRKVFREK
ncbi:MAG: GNAT family N-acetyltransferase [Anaerolineae bacterium]